MLAFPDKVFPLVISTGCHVYHFVKQNVVAEDDVVLLKYYVIVARTFQTTLGSAHLFSSIYITANSFFFHDSYNPSLL
jgi:hypothetical protein